MANLGKKNGIYFIRFRFHGKEYKRSLKIRDPKEADAAKNLVELTIHRIVTGQVTIPDKVDPGDFVVAGETSYPNFFAGLVALNRMGARLR